MGGEPTFVSVDDRDGAEWNTDALGPTKRGFATELVHRLRQKYGQGGFLHFGQGKWYPGEQLPRWALSICWRADGQPCWHDPSLFADERDTHRYTSADAQAFLSALTRRAWASTQVRAAGLRGHLVLPVARTPAAGQRGPVRCRAWTTNGARAPAPRHSRRAWTAAVGYLLPLREWEWLARAPPGPAWITGPVVPARRPHVPDPRRFADGLPAAAGFTALGQAPRATGRWRWSRRTRLRRRPRCRAGDAAQAVACR